MGSLKGLLWSLNVPLWRLLRSTVRALRQATIQRSTISGSAKGAAGRARARARARLQMALQNKPGYFATAIRGNLRRRMGLAAAADGLADPVAYLERFGHFAGQRDPAQIAWLVAQSWRALQLGEAERAEDLMALTFAGLEQASLDEGSMDTGFLLSQVEEAPPILTERRPPRKNLARGTFSQLYSGEWTATTMGYVRELDFLEERRSQLAEPHGGAARGDDPEQAGEGDETGPERKRPPKAKTKAEPKPAA